MEDYLKKLGIEPFINAHDTITRYGGSRMSRKTREAMSQVSDVFVDLDVLQRQLGGQIAALTRNEDAYITGGAAAGVLLAAAVLMARGDAWTYRQLPETTGLNEFIVPHGQHICYDHFLKVAGGKVRFVGDADGISEEDLRRNITEQTAGIFCFPSINYERASMSLPQLIQIAHEEGVPVVVDAAALLPPASNLWAFTKMGADMVVFSGGKTLCGPQASGLILGKAKYIEDCRRFGAPGQGIGRVSKATREDMVGLWAAVEQFLSRDEATESQALSRRVDGLVRGLAGWPLGDPYRVEHGSVGQSYPRAFIQMKEGHCASEVATAMYRQRVFVGMDQGRLYLSPQNLTDEEVEIVVRKLWEVAEAISPKEEK